MEVESVLVTGANRGIGLEFVRQFADLPIPPRHIFATYRNETTLQELKEIKESSKKANIHLIKADVTKDEDIEKLKKIVEEIVGDNGLTLLINNAGVAVIQPFPEITASNLNFHFTTNTIAPIMVTQAMFPLLVKAANLRKAKSGMNFSKAGVLNISSLTGSIENVGKVFTRDLVVPGYKISKAALNMGMRTIAAYVKEKEILIVNMCPGWVKTDMGTDHAELELKESISTILQTLPKLNEEHHGTFMDRFGNAHPF